MKHTLELNVQIEMVLVKTKVAALGENDVSHMTSREIWSQYLSSSTVHGANKTVDLSRRKRLVCLHHMFSDSSIKGACIAIWVVML